MIGEVSKQPAADWPHDEADRKHDGRVQLLNNRVVSRKERIGEVERKGRVCIEVVPLDQIADRADEDRLQSTAGVGQAKWFGSHGGLIHGGHHTKNLSHKSDRSKASEHRERATRSERAGAAARESACRGV